MNTFVVTYKPFGNTAILIEWPSIISKDIINNIHLFTVNIKKNKLEYILEMNYVYNSLLIIYDSDKIDYLSLEKNLKQLYNEAFLVVDKPTKYIWEIPVCYAVEYGIDLALLSSSKNRSIAQIIALHSSTNYLVYGIGFLPGFLYLGGLPKELQYPRKNTPRLEIPKGSVAIGGNQTGIYPRTSPGGWQIIGRTPISLFNIEKENPCTIMPTDEVRFKAISKEEFIRIENEEKKGNYRLKKISRNA
ncbi:5-oxoprolinase subunit PxpB [Lutibacter sp.]